MVDRLSVDLEWIIVSRFFLTIHSVGQVARVIFWIHVDKIWQYTWILQSECQVYFLNNWIVTGSCSELEFNDDIQLSVILYKKHIECIVLCKDDT